MSKSKSKSKNTNAKCNHDQSELYQVGFDDGYDKAASEWRERMGAPRAALEALVDFARTEAAYYEAGLHHATSSLRHIAAILGVKVDKTADVNDLAYAVANAARRAVGKKRR